MDPIISHGILLSKSPTGWEGTGIIKRRISKTTPTKTMRTMISFFERNREIDFIVRLMMIPE